MTLLTGRPTRAALKKLTIDFALGDNCSTIMNQDPCNECRRILPKRESLCSAKLRLGLCAIDLMVKEARFHHGDLVWYFYPRKRPGEL